MFKANTRSDYLSQVCASSRLLVNVRPSLTFLFAVCPPGADSFVDCVPALDCLLSRTDRLTLLALALASLAQCPGPTVISTN